MRRPSPGQGRASTRSRSSLDEQQERAAALDKEHQAIAQELEELRRRLVDAAAGTQDAEVELTRSERALRRPTKEAAKKEEQLTRRRGQMVAMLAALERLALRPADALIVAPSPPVDTVRGALLLNCGAAGPRVAPSWRCAASWPS